MRCPPPSHLLPSVPPVPGGGRGSPRPHRSLRAGSATCRTSRSCTATTPPAHRAPGRGRKRGSWTSPEREGAGQGWRGVSNPHPHPHPHPRVGPGSWVRGWREGDVPSSVDGDLPPPSGEGSLPWGRGPGAGVPPVRLLGPEARAGRPAHQLPHQVGHEPLHPLHQGGGPGTPGRSPSKHPLCGGSAEASEHIGSIPGATMPPPLGMESPDQ